MMIVTSLDPRVYPAEMVLALYRRRWQIEIAFKRLKSLIHIDRLPAKNKGLARTWLYAHLVFALLIDKLAQHMLDSPPCEEGPEDPPEFTMADL
jgi:IS4 transposase